MIRLGVTTSTPTIPYLPQLMMLTFFLGGMTLSTGAGGFYLPFALFLIVPALVFLVKYIRLSVLHAAYLALTLAFLVSCLALNQEMTTSLRQLSGLGIIFLGWLALLAGSVLPILRSNALTLGGFILFGSILILFLSALADGALRLQFVYLIFPASDYAYYNFKNELTTVFGASNYLAAFMLFFVGYAAATRKLLLLGAAIMGVYLTFSKTAIGLMALVLVIMLLSGLVHRLFPHLTAVRRLLVVAVLIAPGVFLYTQFVFDSATLNNDFRLLTLTERTYLWATGWDLIQSSPLFGKGYGSMVDISNVWSVHNGLLDYWLSYGFFAMVLFVVYVGLILRKFYVAARYPSTREEHEVALGVLIGLSLMLLHGMIEPLLLTTQFLIFIGLLAGGIRPFGQAPTRALQPTSQPVLRGHIA